MKDHCYTFLFILVAVTASEIFLLTCKMHWVIRIYFALAIILACIAGFLMDYFKRRKFYNKVLNDLDKLDQKYLIHEMIARPDFFDGVILKEILDEVNKSMVEQVNLYKLQQEEYKEYIELWIHEIKIPIATSKMIIENHKNEVTQSIDEEMDKIENFIEQALYYARSNHVEKDYIIKKCHLQEIVSEVLKKNKNSLIKEKIKIELHDLDIDVYTDFKWCQFILNQIIQNSIKYSQKENKEIEIYANTYKDNVVLYLKDNGIGIKSSEITRVFEKGFTGSNGRNANQKSTGIGLYLCKKLCEKLGMNIKIQSKNENGCIVMIVFPKDSRIELL